MEFATDELAEITGIQIDPPINKKGAEQLRVTTRQFRAVATGNKIMPGETVDDRCIEEMFSLEREAQDLDKNAPNAAEAARSIMDKFEKSVNSMQKKYLRDRHEKPFRSSIEKALAPFINR